MMVAMATSKDDDRVFIFVVSVVCVSVDSDESTSTSFSEVRTSSHLFLSFCVEPLVVNTTFNND